MYDVAIIGAGPAGSVLARMIGAHQKVLLIDRRPLSDPAEEWSPATPCKCCGGLLAPDAQKMLARQGLGLPREVMVGPQLFVVRTIDLRTRQERYYQRHYINLDRERFDRWLVSLIPDEVDRGFGWRFRGYERDDGGFKIMLWRDGQVRTERARMLVGADGAASLLRRRAFPRAPWPRKYVAVQEWFPADEALPYFSAMFDPKLTDFYLWTIPKEDELIVGAALPAGRGAIAKFERAKETLRKFGFHLGASHRRQTGMLLRPVTGRQVCTGADGILLVGEAAGWISPSSAEGFSYAFRSAMALADALRHSPGDVAGAYKKNTKRLRRNIVLKNLKSLFMYKPCLRRAVMGLGIRAVRIRRNE